MLDSAGTAREQAHRIWLQGYPVRDSLGTRRVLPSVNSVSVIKASFPGLVVVDANAPLFLCPPGKGVLMPGYGCPIRDDGVIVYFTPVRVDGRTARVGVSIIRSAGSGERYSTWAADYALDLAFTGERWVVRRKTMVGIT
jgi:hypothetical protein